MATDLPPEIIEAVFEKNESTAVTIACARVCQAWRDPAQSLLFRNVSLVKVHTLSGLLDALQNSPYLANFVKTIVVAPQPPLIWMHHKPTADLAADVLQLIPGAHSLTLRGPYTGHRVDWDSISYKMKGAIIATLSSSSLHEVVVDGWVFKMHAQRYFELVLASPSLKRVSLTACFSSLHTTGSLHPGESRTRVLDLDLLDIKTTWVPSGNIDQNFVPPFEITSTNGLTLRVTLNTEFQELGQLGPRLIMKSGSQVTKLEWAIDYPFQDKIWDLSTFSRLRRLHIKWSPDHLRLSNTHVILDTLRTLPPQNSLTVLSTTLAMAEPSLDGDFGALVETLTSGRFPSLKQVYLSFLCTWDVPHWQQALGEARFKDARIEVVYAKIPPSYRVDPFWQPSEILAYF